MMVALVVVGFQEMSISRLVIFLVIIRSRKLISFTYFNT